MAVILLAAMCRVCASASTNGTGIDSNFKLAVLISSEDNGVDIQCEFYTTGMKLFAPKIAMQIGQP